jgi:hypothetical protein
LTERRRAAIVLGVAALAAAWPLFLPWVYDTHDGHYALYNAAQFHRAVEDGHLPVRWLPDLFGGRGIPHFVFHHPLAFYAVELIRLVIPSTIASVKFFQILVIAAAGFTMREWLRGHLPPSAALAGAVAYVLAPYHLVEVHVRGDPPAMLAYAMVPVVLMGIERAAGGFRLGPAALATASATLVLSHMVSAMLWIPFLGLWALSRTRGAPRGAVARLAGGVAGGAMLSAWHWLPALAERDLVHIDSPLGALFVDYREHFVAWWQWLSPLWGYQGSFAGTRDDMSFQLGPVHLGVALLAAWMLFGSSPRESHRESSRGIALWSLATLLGSLAFTHSLSRIVWDALPFLRLAQYPWRFLAVSALASAALVAWAVARANPTRLVLFATLAPIASNLGFCVVEQNRLYAMLALWTAAVGLAAWLGWRRSDRGAAATSFTLCVLLAGAALPWSAVPFHSRPRGEPVVIPLHESDLSPARVRLGIRRTTARDDYLPRTVQVIPPRDPGQEYVPPPEAESPPPYERLMGSPEIVYLEKRTNRHFLRVTANSPAALALNLHEFPGWEVRLRDPDGVFRKVAHPWDERGRIVLSVPSGTTEIRVVFTRTEPRRAGGWISLAGLALVGLGAVSGKRRGPGIRTLRR